MRPDLDSATERVIAIRAGMAGLPDGATAGARIEDALCEGYATALAGDAWLSGIERRLQELIDDAALETAGREIRVVAAERAAFHGSLLALRDALTHLRRERDRLPTESHAAPQAALARRLPTEFHAV